MDEGHTYRPSLNQGREMPCPRGARPPKKSPGRKRMLAAGARLVSHGFSRDARVLRPRDCVRRAKDQTTPWSSMALATFTNPATLAPRT
jgi:hypothetical protein